MFRPLVQWTRKHKQGIKHKRSEDWSEDEKGQTEVIVRAGVYYLAHNWSHHAAESAEGRAESQIDKLLFWVSQSYYWITCYRKRSITNSFKSTQSECDSSKQLTIPILIRYWTFKFDKNEWKIMMFSYSFSTSARSPYPTVATMIRQKPPTMQFLRPITSIFQPMIGEIVRLAI